MKSWRQGDDKVTVSNLASQHFSAANEPPGKLFPNYPAVGII